MGNYPTTPTHKFCLKKDATDLRDIYHTFVKTLIHDSVKVIDYRSQCPPIYDQGQLGSCTANAIAAAYEFDQLKQNEPAPFAPSRLFIYYNERVIEGTAEHDDGAQIRDGIKTLNSIGVCAETMWPYDISKFATKPPVECYTDAKFHYTVEYKRVTQDLIQLKQCLIEGYPIVFGITCYPSIQSDEVSRTGVVPMPTPAEKAIGGHALLIVGYDEAKKHFIFRNSWGTTWGDQGYGYLPVDYVLDSNLASDFWTVTRVEDESE